MLRIETSVNFDKIDELWIINTGEQNGQGEYLYCLKDERWKDLEVTHDRQQPWYVLVYKVLSAIIEFEVSKK